MVLALLKYSGHTGASLTGAPFLPELFFGARGFFDGPGSPAAVSGTVLPFRLREVVDICYIRFPCTRMGQTQRNADERGEFQSSGRARGTSNGGGCGQEETGARELATRRVLVTFALCDLVTVRTCSRPPPATRRCAVPSVLCGGRPSDVSSLFKLPVGAMYPTLARLVRVLPRSQVDPALRPVPVPVRSDVPKQSLIEILQKRKEEAGEAYPANIRIESLEAKTALRGLPRDARRKLVEMLREH